MKKKWEAQESLPIEELREITNEEREYEAVIEAVLFTMGNSVEVRQLAAAIGQDEETARSAVQRLMKQYEAGRKGMQIIELESSYQMCTRPEYYENLIRVAATPKKQVLTDVVLETLSIIAYKQPVTKMEIEKIRGVKSDHAVNRLVEYNLVYEVGRLDAPGRPALFATTEEFLRRFGVGSVQDLPDLGPEQEAEIKAEVEEELQLKLEELTVEAASEEAAVTAEETAEMAETAMEAAETAETVMEAAETAETAMEAAETAETVMEAAATAGTVMEAAEMDGTAMEAAATAAETAGDREPEA